MTTPILLEAGHSRRSCQSPVNLHSEVYRNRKGLERRHHSSDSGVGVTAAAAAVSSHSLTIQDLPHTSPTVLFHTWTLRNRLVFGLASVISLTIAFIGYDMMWLKVLVQQMVYEI